MQITNLITGETPSVLHRNGNPHEWRTRWPHIVADFFREPIERQPPCPELTVLIWSNRPGKRLVERSLDRWGMTCIKLGEDLPKWRCDMKPFLCADALTRVESEYVLTLDADDILVVAPPAKILADFQAFGCDIVYSGERNSYPSVPHLEAFDRSIAESVYCHLNAGAWIGKAETCRRFFRKLLDEHRSDLVAAHPAAHVLADDQGVTRKTFRHYHPAVQIDYHCRIFQSLFGVSADGEVLITT